MRENRADDLRVGHIGDKAQSAAAVRAHRDVDLEYSLEPLCPRERGSRISLIRLSFDWRRAFFALLGYALGWWPGTTDRRNGELGANTPW